MNNFYQKKVSTKVNNLDLKYELFKNQMGLLINPHLFTYLFEF